MINVEHLNRMYGDQRSVDDLSFDVRPGRLFRLVTALVRSIVARGRAGLSLRTRTRRARSA